MPEYPKPPSRKKKEKKPICPVSQKQQRHNRERQSTYLKMDSKPMFCQGCGTTYGLSHSHRISQRDKRHVANIENIDILCLNCHSLWERGLVWQLDNGQSAMAWLEETDYEAYARKRLQMVQRMEESQISTTDLPGWMQEILAEIQ